MSDDAKSSMVRSTRRTGRRKAMPCGTCKIRKIKCDETRPVCKQCLSTGRRCEGYGVWANFSKADAVRANSVVPRPAMCVSLACLANRTDDERLYFEWYKSRTAHKLPGAFTLTFWEQLVLQASVEPAVMHAVLTLSAVHRRLFDSSGEIEYVPDAQERFMLQHYSKSIGHLRVKSVSKDRPSTRVALIACLVFVSLEFLRGRFRTALFHLRNGLNVLKEFLPHNTDDNDKLVEQSRSRDAVDEWIDEQFLRLNITVELFEQTHAHPFELRWLTRVPAHQIRFQSIKDAWCPLERLIGEILYLKAQHQEHCTTGGSLLAMQKQKRHILEGLKKWNGVFAIFDNCFHFAKLGAQGLQVGRLFRAFYALATIMAEACLSGEDETVYDAVTHHFLDIINISIELAKGGALLPVTPTSKWGSRLNMSHSIMDVGWIPPLYYTALKCRIYRIRMHAIQLIEAGAHREAIWDTHICVAIARKIVTIENACNVKDEQETNGFHLDECPKIEDLSPPNVPQRHRVSEIRVDLPDEPQGQVIVSYKQKEISKAWERVWISV